MALDEKQKEQMAREIFQAQKTQKPITNLTDWQRFITCTSFMF